MSRADYITAARLPLREARNPANRALVLRYAREHATGAAQRALLALVGEASA
jgi:hypothetical protein|tara:strand:- start:671 stop:826 length:156 start_codon:yes stop_codon:yes gene_type:complete